MTSIACELAARRVGRWLRSGEWQVSSFQGVLAAANGLYGNSTSEIHIGDESLRFASAVLQAAPTGSVLDIGCGSGIATVAAARTAAKVHGIDVLDRARSATLTTAALNGAFDRCSVDVADFRQIAPGARFDCVIANLPGVPVPARLMYPTAGNGGEDGLSLIRGLWDWWGAADVADRLVMRFQSLGNREGPSVLDELDARFGAEYEVHVVTDSVAPAAVRDAITARRAAQLTGSAVEDVRAELAVSRATSGHEYFHGSTLTVRRSDIAGIQHIRNHLNLDVGQRLCGRVSAADRSVIAARARMIYPRWFRLMPDEFWEIGGHRHVGQVLELVEIILPMLCDGATPAEVSETLPDHAPESPERLGAALAVCLLANVLVGMGILALDWF